MKRSQNQKLSCIFTVRLPRQTISALRSFAASRSVPSSVLVRVFIDSGLGSPLADSEIERLGLDQ